MLYMRCPRWSRCDAPLCPLDPKLKLRVYENGDRVCTIRPEYLVKIMSSNSKKVYREYIKICLANNIKFTPWREVEKLLYS